MKKLTLSLLIALIGLQFVSYGQSAPNIKFEQTQHNFGQIEEGPEYKHVFKFTNTGDAPLIINNVVTPCGCTSPSFTKEPVLPGKTGDINVSYNSAGRLGNFDKTLTVQTNLGAGKDVYLTIKGEVKEKGTIAKVEEKPAPVEEKKVEEKSAPKKKTKTKKSASAK